LIIKVLDILFVYLKHFIVSEAGEMPGESKIENVFENKGFICELDFFFL
jgi:hypothetical protein